MGFLDSLLGKSAEDYFYQFNYQAESGDIRSALRSLIKAADKGHIEAQQILGNVYYNGEYLPRDLNQAFHYSRMSAMAGNIIAKYQLGHHYYSGKGVAEDKSTAMKYWKEAADAGHEDAHWFYEHCKYYDFDERELALSYYSGSDGQEVNIPEAIKIFEKGASMFDDCQAIYMLGHIEMVGAPPYRSQNIESGLAKILEAAKKGEFEAFLRLMSIYRFGNSYDGIPFEKDEALAGKYAVEIAESVDELDNDLSNGIIYATAAWAYMHGHGVQQNCREARMYLDRNKPHHFNGFVKAVDEELRMLGY